MYLNLYVHVTLHCFLSVVLCGSLTSKTLLHHVPHLFQIITIPSKVNNLRSLQWQNNLHSLQFLPQEVWLHYLYQTMNAFSGISSFPHKLFSAVIITFCPWFDMLWRFTVRIQNYFGVMKAYVLFLSKSAGAERRWEKIQLLRTKFDARIWWPYRSLAGMKASSILGCIDSIVSDCGMWLPPHYHHPLLCTHQGASRILHTVSEHLIQKDTDNLEHVQQSAIKMI